MFLQQTRNYRLVNKTLLSGYNNLRYLIFCKNNTRIMSIEITGAVNVPKPCNKTRHSAQYMGSYIVNNYTSSTCKKRD